MLSTFGDGLLIGGLAALMLVGSAMPLAWARWVLRGTPRARTLAIVLTAGVIIGLLIGGAAVWVPLTVAVPALAVVARRHFPRGGRIAAATLIVMAGLPLWAATALYALFAVAMFGCAPDAYECPF